MQAFVTSNFIHSPSQNALNMQLMNISTCYHHPAMESFQIFYLFMTDSLCPLFPYSDFCYQQTGLICSEASYNWYCSLYSSVSCFFAIILAVIATATKTVLPSSLFLICAIGNESRPFYMLGKYCNIMLYPTSYHLC